MADQEGRRETIQESPIIKAQTIFPTQDGELHSKRKAPPPIGGIASGYAAFGSVLGSWDAACARIGCGEDRVDLAGLAIHPRRRTLGLLNSHFLLHEMVTRHTQFFKRIQATFKSCSQDTYVAATTISSTLWVVGTDELRLDWS